MIDPIVGVPGPTKERPSEIDGRRQAGQARRKLRAGPGIGADAGVRRDPGVHVVGVAAVEQPPWSAPAS